MPNAIGGYLSAGRDCAPGKLANNLGSKLRRADGADAAAQVRIRSNTPWRALIRRGSGFAHPFVLRIFGAYPAFGGIFPVCSKAGPLLRGSDRGMVPVAPSILLLFRTSPVPSRGQAGGRRALCLTNCSCFVLMLPVPPRSEPWTTASAKFAK